MNADIPALLRDRNIELSERGKHGGKGWTNMRCPFCDDQSDHLGWNLAKGYFSCWKCGHHKTDETLSEILGITEHEAYLLMLKYQVHPSTYAHAPIDPYAQARPGQVIVPGGDVYENQAAWNYLSLRGYDEDKIARTWNLTATGTVGRYKFRIICPIWYGGEIVSFQGRDYTGKSKLRWKTCDKEHEIRDHKHCLGGSQLAKGDSVAIVEGFTDAWRLGPGAVCTFGTAYLPEQVALIKRWKRRFIILDSEEKDPNARVQADRLANMLSAFGGETHLVELDSGDPGDMAQDDADALMRELKIK